MKNNFSITWLENKRKHFGYTKTEWAKMLDVSVGGYINWTLAGRSTVLCNVVCIEYMNKFNIPIPEELRVKIIDNRDKRRKNKKMTEILDFRKEAEKHEDMIWQCNCGNCSFKIYEDGRVKCACCGEFGEPGCEYKQVIEKWTRSEEEENE